MSFQGRIINAKEFGVRCNKIVIAPSLGKSFAIHGKVFHPYLTIPYGINLVGNQTYQTTLNANVGIVGNLPFRRYQGLVGNIEANAGIKDGFVGFSAGLSWHIE